MPLHPATRQFLAFLRSHPALRDLIRAGPGQAVFYAGSFVKPLWEELSELKRRYPEVARKVTLSDALSRIHTPGMPFSNLLAYAQEVERQVPQRPDAFILWRALSGIYAANAVGKVSFQIGSGVTALGRVFAATELAILLRNPRVDETTKDLLAYYDRCIRSGEDAINVGFISS
jgi:hypothetical protein